MQRLFFVSICVAGILAFGFFLRYLITGVSSDFGLGLVAGMVLFFAIMWFGEKVGGFKVVEPENGKWIPHDGSPPFGSDRDF